MRSFTSFIRMTTTPYVILSASEESLFLSPITPKAQNETLPKHRNP
jgi:hypothetical protein